MQSVAGRSVAGRVPFAAPVGGSPGIRTIAANATTQNAKLATRSGTTRKGTTTSSTVKQQTRSNRAPRDTPGPDDDDKPKGWGSRFYTFITGFPFPLGPAFIRDTVRREVEPGSVWVFEQTQALENVYVYTPVRMTVIKLKSGGLWVHAPIAPTGECIRLLKELDAPVEYIVLSTFAYEHKAFVGPFSRKFPDAKVYVTPYQWSFPLNLPLQFFGIFPAGVLGLTEEGMPWEDEIEQRMLLPPSIGIGEYARQGECAFFHKATRTLMVTDAVIYISDDIPSVIPKKALLESARDSWLNRFRAGNRTREEVKAIAKPEPAADTLENRIRGWRRMSLLVLYFNPSNLLEPDESYEALSDRLIVPPVVETLVYSKFKGAVRDWVDDIVAAWNFNKIIPCHFIAPVRASPADFKRAFTFAYEDVAQEEDSTPVAKSGPAAFLASLFGGAKAQSAPMTRPVVFPEADISTLRAINNLLLSLKVVREV